VNARDGSAEKNMFVGKSNATIPQFRGTTDEPFSAMMEVKDDKAGFTAKRKQECFVIFTKDRNLQMFTDTSKSTAVPISGSGPTGSLSVAGGVAKCTWLDKNKFKCEVSAGSQVSLHITAKTLAEAEKLIHIFSVASMDTAWQQYIQGTTAAKSSSSSGNPPRRSMATLPPPPVNPRDAQENKLSKRGSIAIRKASQDKITKLIEEELKHMSDKEKLETKVIAVLLASYFDIIRIKIMDSVPKAIMLKLVETMKKEMLGEILGQLYRPEIVDELLSETEENKKQRKELKEAVDLMKSALANIQNLEKTF